MNKIEKKVVELLIKNPSLTLIELSEKIGITKRTIERTFKFLQEKKMETSLKIMRRLFWFIGNKQDGIIYFKNNLKGMWDFWRIRIIQSKLLMITVFWIQKQQVYPHTMMKL